MHYRDSVFNGRKSWNKFSWLVLFRNCSILRRKLKIKLNVHRVKSDTKMEKKNILNLLNYIENKNCISTFYLYNPPDIADLKLLDKYCECKVQDHTGLEVNLIKHKKC